ncbi:hypothetical protein D8770_25975 [Methylobacterium sp. DB1607]|nr:hypothetical protein [Methylobacterium sp. DB1607]
MLPPDRIWIADRMNALTAYFADTGDNLARLAERIGRSPSTITRPLRGERNVSMNVAREIERATDGRVSAAQFIAICLEAQKGAAAASAEPSDASEAQDVDERAKPLRCLSAHGSAAFATEGQSR